MQYSKVYIYMFQQLTTFVCFHINKFFVENNNVVVEPVYIPYAHMSSGLNLGKFNLVNQDKRCLWQPKTLLSADTV